VLPVERGAAYQIVVLGVAIAVVALALNPFTEMLQRGLRRAFEVALGIGARGLGLKA
jgi:hypothetical protein